MFSLMTHVTINTLQLSGSAYVYGRVYWLRLPGGPCRAQLIVFQTGAGGAPRNSGAQQPHRRRLTHIAAQRESAIFNLTWRTVRGGLRFLLLLIKAIFLNSLSIVTKSAKLLKKSCFSHLMAHTVEFILMLSGSHQVAVGSQLTGQQSSAWRLP